MNMRKITSLTALLSFALEMLTSVILYIVPRDGWPTGRSGGCGA